MGRGGFVKNPQSCLMWKGGSKRKGLGHMLLFGIELKSTCLYLLEQLTHCDCEKQCNRNGIMKEQMSFDFTCGTRTACIQVKHSRLIFYWPN